jgi:ribosomal protein S5
VIDVPGTAVPGGRGDRRSPVVVGLGDGQGGLGLRVSVSVAVTVEASVAEAVAVLDRVPVAEDLMVATTV